MTSVVVLAVVAAIAWGLSDFVGGAWVRRASMPIMLAISKLSGMALAGLTLAVRAVPVPSDPRLLLAALAGLCGVPAMALLYLAMRTGPLAIVAPVAAAAALIAVGWGVAGGDQFNLVGSLGIVATLAGITLVSWPLAVDRRHSTAATVRSLAYATGAAVGFGAYFVLLHEASTTDPYWSTAMARTAGGVAVLGIGVVWFSRQGWWRLPISMYGRADVARVARQGAALLPFALASCLVGGLDAVADGAYAVASVGGSLGIAAMLSSTYPAVTVLLGIVLLKERIHRVRFAGVAFALVGVVCLSAVT